MRTDEALERKLTKRNTDFDPTRKFRKYFPAKQRTSNLILDPNGIPTLQKHSLKLKYKKYFSRSLRTNQAQENKRAKRNTVFDPTRKFKKYFPQKRRSSSLISDHNKTPKTFRNNQKQSLKLKYRRYFPRSNRRNFKSARFTTNTGFRIQPETNIHKLHMFDNPFGKMFTTTSKPTSTEKGSTNIPSPSTTTVSSAKPSTTTTRPPISQEDSAVEVIDEVFTPVVNDENAELIEILTNEPNSVLVTNGVTQEPRGQKSLGEALKKLAEGLKKAKELSGKSSSNSLPIKPPKDVDDTNGAPEEIAKKEATPKDISATSSECLVFQFLMKQCIPESLKNGLGSKESDGISQFGRNDVADRLPKLVMESKKLSPQESITNEKSAIPDNNISVLNVLTHSLSPEEVLAIEQKKNNKEGESNTNEDLYNGVPSDLSESALNIVEIQHSEDIDAMKDRIQAMQEKMEKLKTEAISEEPINVEFPSPTNDFTTTASDPTVEFSVEDEKPATFSEKMLVENQDQKDPTSISNDFEEFSVIKEKIEIIRHDLQDLKTDMASIKPISDETLIPSIDIVTKSSGIDQKGIFKEPKRPTITPVKSIHNIFEATEQDESSSFLSDFDDFSKARDKIQTIKEQLEHFRNDMAFLETVQNGPVIKITAPEPSIVLAPSPDQYFTPVIPKEPYQVNQIKHQSPDYTKYFAELSEEIQNLRNDFEAFKSFSTSLNLDKFISLENDFVKMNEDIQALQLDVKTLLSISSSQETVKIPELVKIRDEIHQLRQEVENVAFRSQNLRDPPIYLPVAKASALLPIEPVIPLASAPLNTQENLYDNMEIEKAEIFLPSFGGDTSYQVDASFSVTVTPIPILQSSILQAHSEPIKNEPNPPIIPNTGYDRHGVHEKPAVNHFSYTNDQNLEKTTSPDILIQQIPIRHPEQERIRSQEISIPIEETTYNKAILNSQLSADPILGHQGHTDLKYEEAAALPAGPSSQHPDARGKIVEEPSKMLTLQQQHGSLGQHNINNNPHKIIGNQNLAVSSFPGQYKTAGSQLSYHHDTAVEQSRPNFQYGPFAAPDVNIVPSINHSGKTISNLPRQQVQSPSKQWKTNTGTGGQPFVYPANNQHRSFGSGVGGPGTYRHEYMVVDNNRDVAFAKDEMLHLSENGESTAIGEYRTLLPDCRTQVVKYHTSGEHTGNVADVSYLGTPCPK